MSSSSSEPNQSQEEGISHFCGITGADEERARCMLEACNWNLELAINMHVDSDPGSNASVGESRPREEVIRPPIAPVRQILNPGPLEFPLPNRRLNRPEVYDAFRDFQEEANYQEILHGEGEEAAENSVNRRVTLQQLYRPPLELMCRGSLTLARETGQEQNKWILVNIQNGVEFSCQVLNRDVWSNQAVKDILKNNFIFWQVYHDSYEGLRYVRFYNVHISDLPHVAVIDPRTGELMKSWSKSIDPASFCDSITEFLIDHPSPNGGGSEKAEMIDKSEDAQLAAAITASLNETTKNKAPLADASFDDVVIIEDEPETKEELKKKDPSKEVVKEVEEVKEPRKETFEQFEGPECKIALRFPDGSTVVRRFGASQKLRDIHNFVKYEKSASSVEFVAPPNRKLDSLLMDETLESLGLCPASRLEVRYVQ